CAREPWIDVNNLRPALSRLDYPLKPDRMVLCHRRSHDQDRVCVTQVLLRSRRPASSKACAQTGHSGAVSYTGLVGDANHAQTSGEELLDQVIFFNIE